MSIENGGYRKRKSFQETRLGKVFLGTERRRLITYGVLALIAVTALIAENFNSYNRNKLPEPIPSSSTK